MYYYALGYFYQHWLVWLVQISKNRAVPVEVTMTKDISYLIRLKEDGLVKQ